MKKIITLLLLSLSLGIAAQVKEVPSAKGTHPAKSCVLVFSEEEQALVYRSNDFLGSEILIESLPNYGEESIPVEISQMENGSFTFKKHPALTLPEYYSVVIKDKYTGESFDLKAADSYTFDIHKDVPERFVLSMSKIKTKLTSMN